MNGELGARRTFDQQDRGMVRHVNLPIHPTCRPLAVETPNLKKKMKVKVKISYG